MSEDFNKRLDAEMDVLVDSFTDIITASKIQAKEAFTLAEEGYQLECRATTIARSCQTLLAMIATMKQSLLLNDTRSINAITQAHRQQAQARTTATHQVLGALKQQVDRMVCELQASLADPLPPIHH